MEIWSLFGEQDASVHVSGSKASVCSQEREMWGMADGPNVYLLQMALVDDAIDAEL